MRTPTAGSAMKRSNRLTAREVVISPKPRDQAVCVCVNACQQQDSVISAKSLLRKGGTP